MSPAELERHVSRAVSASSTPPPADGGASTCWRALLASYQRAWRGRYAPRGLLPGRGGDAPVLVRGGGRCGALREGSLAEGVLHSGGADGGSVPGDANAAALLRAAGAVIAVLADRFL